MRFEQFERLITTFTNGVKLINGQNEIIENYYELLKNSLSSYYTEEGINWVNCYVNRTENNQNTTKVRNYVNEPRFYASVDDDGKLINFTFDSENYDDVNLTEVYNTNNEYSLGCLMSDNVCYGVTDNDGTPVHTDIKTLWTYLEQEHKH